MTVLRHDERQTIARHTLPNSLSSEAMITVRKRPQALVGLTPQERTPSKSRISGRVEHEPLLIYRVLFC